MSQEVFFEMEPTMKWRALHVDIQLGWARRSPGLITGCIVPQEPIQFTWNSGTKPYDIIGTSSAGLYLLSPRLIELLRREGFTGWATWPAEVFGRKEERIPGYGGLSVTGRSGPAIIPKTVAEARQRTARLGHRVGPTVRGGFRGIGIEIDPATWDGSDFFLPRGDNRIIVTKRVRDTLARAKATNVNLTRLSDCGYYVSEQA